jgi:hypothetical protein
VLADSDRSVIVVVAALELLGLLVTAAGLGGTAGALLAVWSAGAPWSWWVGVLVAGVVILLGAARADSMTGGRGAAVRSSGSR